MNGRDVRLEVRRELLDYLGLLVCVPHGSWDVATTATGRKDFFMVVVKLSNLEETRQAYSQTLRIASGRWQHNKI